MKKVTVFILAALLAYLPYRASAWGMLGHRIVGEIADSYLTPKARAAIKEILGNESLAIASNWPDFVKSDTAFKSYDPWHYCNFEDGISKDSMERYLKTDTAVDAYAKLTFIIKELKSNKLTKEKKVFYLRYLIHIVGDIHQPLHLGRATDLGANKIKVKWFSEETNLHSVWDDKLISMQNLSYTEYVKAINFATPAERAKWQKQPIADWFFESYTLSRKIYNSPLPDTRTTYRYNFDHIATANSQLLKGGVRLAGLLNSIFDK